MRKHDARAPVLVEDFAPFYMRTGLLWIPYISREKQYLHCLTPQIAFKGIELALKCLGAGGKIIPFAARALSDHAKG